MSTLYKGRNKIISSEFSSKNIEAQRAWDEIFFKLWKYVTMKQEIQQSYFLKQMESEGISRPKQIKAIHDEQILNKLPISNEI